MNGPVITREMIHTKGREAFAAGKGRDSHAMNWHAPSLPIWRAGWDDASFTAEMERLFGTDEALGVRFDPDGCSYLPHGGSACCCTDYALHIYWSLPGRVQIFGFANEENPTSSVARNEIHPCGHDFAIVDQRYIVDPWPRLVPMAFEQMVFALEHDAALVLDIYGPRTCWTRMTAVEAYAHPTKVAA